jgi:hypothetical protein
MRSGGIVGADDIFFVALGVGHDVYNDVMGPVCKGFL